MLSNKSFLLTCQRNFAYARNSKPKISRKNMKPMAKRPIIIKQRATNEAHMAKALEMGLGWRIVGATVMHRYPTILPDPAEWEIKMADLQEKIGLLQREFFMENVGGTDAQMICDTNPTYEEIIEAMPFQPASRITEADVNNDRKSVDRNLQGSMFLIVKRNREDQPWQFPQGRLLDSETNMRTVAERVIDRAIGKTRRWFISNTPIGHYCYAYPPAMQLQRKQYGAMVYFYRCQIIEGGVRLETKLYKDYAWISRYEVNEYFDKDFAEYCKELLPA